MARGASSKEIIKNKILEVFDDAFVAADGKTIRVPLVEDGEVVEIKIALTAAKDVEGGGTGQSGLVQTKSAEVTTPAIVEPTQEEIDAVNKLMESLPF